MSQAAGQLVETPDRDGAFPRLTEDRLAELAGEGERRRTHAGQVLFAEGDESYDFHVVLDGLVAVVDGYGGPDERLIAVHGRGRFLGELGLLTGQAAFFTAVVREPGEVLVLPVARLRSIISQDTALGDLLLRAYFMRRELLIGLGAGFRIIGSRFSPDARRLREFVARNRLPHRWIDLEDDETAEALLREIGVAPQQTPVVIWRGKVLRNPSNEELARVVGLARHAPEEATCDLLVVGAGPSGLAASVYGASEGLDTITLDAVATGGQAGTSSKIENYLGFPAGISGAELGERAAIQARKFGADIVVPAEAVGLESEQDRQRVRLADGGELLARTVIVASGAHYRRLSIPRLEEFEGDGVYYAATLTEARMCAGDPVVVVGGGNSAGQATLFLSHHTAELRLVVRGDSLAGDMSRYLADRIERSRVEVLLGSEVRELEGDGRLEGVVVESRDSGERRRLAASALFVFIGADPHTQWLQGQLKLDRKGFVLTGPAAAGTLLQQGRGPRQPLLLETSRPGVLAVGDVRSGSIKRVASAVGEGSISVHLVHEFLERADRHPHHVP
ncbi:MAG: cyclic nucleotide-binding protein [Solirubrobacterales bacterium]|nr:cyclic nucleotide-binding protein [Solirubrobacterales bacterium]